ncbi:HD domain-containing protein [Knoellia koreensis]|uniref:Metal-dependent phosphohydrolase n=1 Tax=Knoellia koreensis TaxID=2730921 RepID=A0A849HKG7_9MICO|nr:metal-dependent phosphohydrolase [Knoellia sp. DB2414S]NNM46831.1 metal-dependent phosphohydrolase [Knoellia sp. DB2414S]
MPALITWWTLDLRELAPQAHSDAVQAVGADLLRRWTEPHRRYHTTTHLVEVFWALEDLEQAGVVDTRDAALGRLVGWFHDAVYDPAAALGDNETASAALASRDLHALGLKDSDVETVRDLILATERHDLAPDGLATAFHDADLWILSAPPERYAAYTEQVREEYAAVPDDAFRAGRAAILRPFLDRDTIYATDLARDTWESQARANLAAELTALTQ